MRRFTAGADRGQSTLLPECLDDWVDESNPVRAVDALVDALTSIKSASMASFPRRRVDRLTIDPRCSNSTSTAISTVLAESTFDADDRNSAQRWPEPDSLGTSEYASSECGHASFLVAK